MSFKVTAIVSAYFAEQYLEARLKNLAEQEIDGELQVIVICQQESQEIDIACKYQKKFGNIVIATDDIPTVYASWNLAIEEAQGEYLTNANSDDILKPGALHTLATALDEHKDYAVAYFDWDRVAEGLDIELPPFHFAEGGLDKLLYGCFLGPGPMWRASLHEKYGLFDPEFKSAGDYEFWLRLAYNGEKFFHVRGDPLGVHLERENGVEHRSPVQTTWETARARGRYRNPAPTTRGKEKA